MVSNQSTSKNHVICDKPSVNLMLCCIKHTHIQQGGAGTTKVPTENKNKMKLKSFKLAKNILFIVNRYVYQIHQECYIVILLVIDMN